MNLPLILLIAAAVALVVGLLVVMRRTPSRPEEAPPATSKKAGETEAPAKEPAELSEVRRPQPVSKRPSAAPIKPAKEESEPEPSRQRPPAPAASTAESEAKAEAAAVAPPAPKPPGAAELRERVAEILEDAERILGDLRAATAGGEGDATGSVEILAEGLAEVRSLAEDKDWGQAKDKGEALRAQLSLMLQTARREQAS